MILQLNPMIPIYRVSDKTKGYAFLVIDYSQEHNLLFTCAMDDGEVWTLSNKEIRFQKNISLDRFNLCKDTSQTKIKFTEEEWAELNNGSKGSNVTSSQTEIKFTEEQ